MSLLIIIQGHICMVCKPDQSSMYHLQFPCNLLWYIESVSPVLNIVPVSSHLMH